MKKIKKALSVVLSAALAGSIFAGCRKAPDPLPFTGEDYTIPELDLSVKPDGLESKYDYLYELSTVDNSQDYMAHPDSVLLKSGDILTVYPIGHGRGAIQNKISRDGGVTYDGSIKSTPKSWEESLETPTIYRLSFTDGSEKLILISGNPQWWDIEEETIGGFNCSLSDDEGQTWTEFERFYDRDSKFPTKPIVAMASLTQLKENGDFVDKWLGLFHDSEYCNYKTILSFDENGKMQWSTPEKYMADYREIEEAAGMCEVECIRSNGGEGDELCILARSNKKTMNSLISFSTDEGKTWSEPREAPAALNGERHKADYTPDGRLFITFRSIERGPKAEANAPKGTTGGWVSEGWIGWVGTYDDLKSGAEGQYRIKLAHIYKDKQKEPEYIAEADTGYCGNVVLPDGTIVTSSYGHYDPNQKTENGKALKTFIASKRINLSDTDELIKAR